MGINGRVCNMNEGIKMDMYVNDKLGYCDVKEGLIVYINWRFEECNWDDKECIGEEYYVKNKDGVWELVDYWMYYLRYE